MYSLTHCVWIRFKANFLKSIGRSEEDDGQSVTMTEWENIFWSITDDGCCPLSVEYGSEIPSSREMTGFPMDKKDHSNPHSNSRGNQDGEGDGDGDGGDINYAEHEFNLMNIKGAKGNILKYLGRDISGMTYPWIYVGMLFTAFGWHYEDHYAYSVNYNHRGAVKQWYGIPGLRANDAEAAMKKELGGHFEQFDLVTLISPLLLHTKLSEATFLMLPCFQCFAFVEVTGFSVFIFSKMFLHFGCLLLRHLVT